MRALNLYGLFGVSVVLFGACGGESGLSPDGPGSEAGEAGQGSSRPNPPGEGGAGGEASGTGGFAGDPSPSGGKGGTGGTVGTGGTIGKGGAPAAGGRVTGGVPSMGGGKSMPQAGDPNIPDPPEPPAGCTPVGLGTSIYDCYVEMTCDDGQYLYTSCSDQRNGSWICACQDGKRPQVDQYTITGLAGSAACSAIADFCASGEVPNPGPEECSKTSASRTSSYCYVEETCTRPFEIEDGVEAGVSRMRYANCTQSGSVQLCSCQNGYQYQISGQDGTTACDTLLPLCEDTPPELGEPVCVPQNTSGGSGYCESQTQCSQTAEVSEGVFATLVQNRYIYCSSQSTGRSTCNCSNERSSTRFDVELPTDGALCGQVSAGCDVTGVELEGPITCAPASQTAGGGYCNAQVDCRQAGTVGDFDLWLYGTLFTSCSQVNGVWTCNCSTSNESANVEVDAESDWDACTAAIQACPDVVDVKIGESNGGIFPPGFPGPIPF